MKLGVISLGCDKATVDSERLVGELVGHGAVVTPELAGADVILVNTCGFIDAAKQESIDAMLEAAKLKAQGVKAVVAVGCLIQRYKQELTTEIPEVDLMLGFSELHHLVPELAKRGLIEDPIATHPGVRQFLGEQSHVRYLKISEGCDHTCAFCAIPLMRGKHRSEPVARLVREAQLLEAQGAKEINLVAQDLGHYGRDAGRGAPALPDLLEAPLAATPVPWYRLLFVLFAGPARGAARRNRGAVVPPALCLLGGSDRSPGRADRAGVPDPPVPRHPHPARLRPHARADAPPRAPAHAARKAPLAARHHPRSRGPDPLPRGVPGRDRRGLPAAARVPRGGAVRPPRRLRLLAAGGHSRRRLPGRRPRRSETRPAGGAARSAARHLGRAARPVRRARRRGAGGPVGGSRRRGGVDPRRTRSLAGG